MDTRSRVRRAATLLVVSLAAPPLSGAVFQLSRVSVDGGGLALSTGGRFTLSATTAQLDAGKQMEAHYTIAGGFWFAEPPSDCNATGNADLLDYSDFKACMMGPSAGLDAGCDCFDTDLDGDIDLKNFADFQLHLMGL
jgi:hypothetical protein